MIKASDAHIKRRMSLLNREIIVWCKKVRSKIEEIGWKREKKKKKRKEKDEILGLRELAYSYYTPVIFSPAKRDRKKPKNHDS